MEERKRKPVEAELEDSASSKPSTAAAAAASDWRSLLEPKCREKAVATIIETLKKNSADEHFKGLTDVALKLEGDIYAAARSENEYFLKISKNVLPRTMKNPNIGSIYPSISNSGIRSQDSASLDMQSQANIQDQLPAVSFTNHPQAIQSIFSQNLQNITGSASLKVDSMPWDEAIVDIQEKIHQKPRPNMLQQQHLKQQEEQQKVTQEQKMVQQLQQHQMQQQQQLLLQQQQQQQELLQQLPMLQLHQQQKQQKLTQFSGTPILSNVGYNAHQQAALGPLQSESLAVGMTGTSASPLPVDSTSPDGNLAIARTGKTSATERPIEHLIRAVQSSSPKVLSSSRNDIRSAVSMIDRIDSPAFVIGSSASIGEEQASTTKRATCCITAMPLGNVPSFGSTIDNSRELSIPEASELESTATRVKRQKVQVNQALVKEIREINKQLIDTAVTIVEGGVDWTAAAGASGETVVKISFAPVSLSPNMRSHLALVNMSPDMVLRLHVPSSYPKCSPIILDKLPAESRNAFQDFSFQAKSRFEASLGGLSQPVSLTDMARTWDASAWKVITQYAEQHVGGSFSSKYKWEDCVRD